MKARPLTVLFLTIFLDLLGFGIIIPILPLFATELGASGTQVGLIAGIFSFMQFAFATFWGGLSDRIGRRPVLLISITIMAASYLIFGWAEHLWVLFAARMLAGFGAANLSAAQAYISDISTPANRTKNFGLIGAAFGLGFLLGPPIGGIVKEHFGVAWVGYFAMALSLLNLVFAFTMLPESLKQKNPDSPVFSNPLKDIFSGLSRVGIRDLLGINFIFTAAFSMMHVTAALMWAEHYGYSEAQIGYIFAYIGFLAVVIQGGLIGWFSKKFQGSILMIAGNLLMFVGLTFLPFVPVNWFIPLALVLLAFLSLGNSFLTPTINTKLSEVALTHEKGKVLGTNQSFGSLARVFGPLLGGALYGIHYQLPYLVSGALMLVAGYFSLKLHQRTTP